MGEQEKKLLHELGQTIRTYFNLQECEDLCRSLGIDPEASFGSATLQEITRDFPGYMWRRGRLDELIEALERERPKVVNWRQYRVETQKRTNRELDKFINALLRMDFDAQATLYNECLQLFPTAAILIYGPPDHGHRFLLKRIISQKMQTCFTPWIIDPTALTRSFDVGDIWEALGEYMGLSLRTQETVINTLYQTWLTQDIALIIHNAGIVSQDYLEQLIFDVWRPIIQKLKELDPLALLQNRNKLLLILVDEEGLTEMWEESVFVKELDETWEPSVPVRLPKLTAFSENTLASWIRHEQDRVPRSLVKNVGTEVHHILQSSQNGVPVYAIKELCIKCEIDWYEVKRRCQKY